MNRFVHRFAFVFLVALLAPAFAGTQPVAFRPFKASGIYALGEKSGWTITLPADADPKSAASYTYTLKKNNADVISAGKLEFTKGTATVATSLDEPAMLMLSVVSSADDKTKQKAGAAVAPTQLQPSIPCPADFDAFWKTKVDLLHTIPVEPVLTPGESGKESVEYSTVKLNNINGAHVYGQLAKPAREGKFPAVLILQWAGGPYPLQKSWVTDRAAEGWLALNVEPHDVPGNMTPEFYAALPTLIKRYNTIYNDDRDRNYFLQMYLGDYRALDYLTSRPDWDGKTLVVMGTSMGGQQTLALSGLHPKVTHLIVHVPAGADSHGSLHHRNAGYPNWDFKNPKVMETAPYFDTVNFAMRIKAKSLVSMGFIDEVCPPVGIWIAFNQIHAPKEVVPLVEAAHNHQSTPEQQRAYTERSKAWLDALVKGEEPTILDRTGG